MRAALKTAVVVAPFLIAYLIIRLVSGGDAGRLRDRVAAFDPDAVVGVDEETLIIVAPGVARAQRAADHLRGFRDGLLHEFGDILGTRALDRPMLVAIFSNPDQLRALAAAEGVVKDPSNVHGYTDPKRGAIFVPADDVKTLRHEAVHWVLAVSWTVVEPFSPWLNEGLAQLFERYDPEARPPVAPGIGVEERSFMRLVLNGTIDVERLLALQDYGEFVGREGQRNYLEALVLTGFLFERRPRAQLREYIEAESGTAPEFRAELFEATYGYRSEAFARDLRAYVAELTR